MEHLKAVVKRLKDDRYGAGLVYELWEMRFHAAIRREIAKPIYSQEERDYILANTDPNATKEIDHLASWSCEACGDPVSESELAQSLNTTSKSLCGSCLAKEIY